MTQDALDAMLEEFRDMLRAAVADALNGNLHPANVGFVDGLLWALCQHPDSSTYSHELLQAAVGVHRKQRAKREACKCGLTPACGSEASGVRLLADELAFLEDDDIADIDETIRAIERAREKRARETLEDRVFGTLYRARREMSAREIADRIGGEATGPKVGAVLKRLHAEGRVKSIEYHSRRSGYTTTHWIATEWDDTVEDQDDDRVNQLIEQLSELADS